MSLDAEDWEPPQEVEEYRLIRELGRGTMGRVYIAHDRLLDRLVAIKFIARAVFTETARRRFFVEARAVARLSHPNVVAIHRVAEWRGRPFLVSEYVRGRTLADLAKPLPAREVLAIATDLARGLAAAHRRGVLHRDIKPANSIRAEDGTTKVLDFGLAELNPGTAPGGGTTSVGLSSTRRVRPPEGDIATARTATVDAPENGAPGEGGAPAPSDTGPTVIGTPLYMAPEIWRGEPPTTRSDIYSLGAVIYELCSGHAPYAGIPSHALWVAVLTDDVPSLGAVAPSVDPRLAEIVDRCLRRDPSLRFADGEALRDALEGLGDRAVSAQAIAPVGPPYRGLFVFEAEHRPLFFGRRSEALTVVERLRCESLVVIAGDSGTGKSSLCRAGVLPLIADGALGARTETIHVPLGRRPLASFASAVSRLIGVDETAVIHHLRYEPATLSRDLRKRNQKVVFFFDQLEELCTVAGSDEGTMTAEALHALADPSNGVRFLATARSDFLTRLTALPGLGEDLPGALYLLRPLSAERLREVVVGPAAARGFAFESDEVIRSLVEEAQGADGSLPLLQFALTELWDARDEKTGLIPSSALARIGGVSGALARHADDVISSLATSDRQVAREIFLLLVTPEGTRAQRGRAELIDGVAHLSRRTAQVIDALVRGRLLVAQETEDGGTAYAIAHEALLRGWDTLRAWLSRDAEGRALRQRIERAAAEWGRLGRAKELLWKERLLKEAAGIDESTLPARDAEFLTAGRRAAARRRMGRWLVAAGLVFALLGTVFGIELEVARERTAALDKARQALDLARDRRVQLLRMRAEAFRTFDAGSDVAAERLWDDVSVVAREVERAYAETENRLGILLQKDPADGKARDLWRDVLYDRASLAEEGHLPEEGSSLRPSTGGLGALARISIETTPPGAKVSLSRYELQAGRLVESAPSSLGLSPVAERDIEPGSYVLSFARAGGPVVRFPVVVRPRREPLRLSVPLPATSAVPPGFVYVAPGRFLYGSRGGSELRMFYDSQPIRSLETDAYLIERDETTYGEWIQFLRALPAAERAMRLPAAERQGFALKLVEQPGGAFRLQIGPDDHPYEAGEGEPIVYTGRKLRASQDWLRMPVSGISFDDVLAYTAWLDQTGRVPGARPCTEYEWERAARGADGRGFPAGERLAPDDANHDVTYGAVRRAFGPDEVGSHPRSDSPFGVRDLAGNVWEWTASTVNPKRPVARGGCFFQWNSMSRSENRAQDMLERKDAYYGVRVCASVRSL